MSKALENLRSLDAEAEASAWGEGMRLRLDLAELLWKGLKQRGWSQKKLARESGMSESFISGLVHGNQNFRVDAIGKVLYALGVRAEIRLAAT